LRSFEFDGQEFSVRCVGTCGSRWRRKEESGRSERAFIASGGGMRRSEDARVSEEAVRRKGGGGGPRKLGMG